MRESFHERFLAAVAGTPEALASWCAGPAVEAGLAVYRNTAAKGCVDALVSQFPTVERVVGPAWLAAAARAHAADHPPHSASLLNYGDAFPAWLAAFPPAGEMPYLADLAKLDWLWTCAHLATDAEPLDPALVAALPPAAFSARTLVLHPATRFAGFTDGVPSLWRALQTPGDPPAVLELGDGPEGLLFVRPHLETTSHVIGAGTLAFLCACAASRSLAEAGAAALATEPGLDLADSFATLVATGAFTTLRTLP